MAELAAGALVAEQVVSTAVEGGAVAGYAVAKSTMPLKATLVQIGQNYDNDTAEKLALSHQTLTIIGNKAYIFGGETTNGKLASNDIHVLILPSSDTKEAGYVPAVSEPLEVGGDVPVPRSQHAACARGKHVVVFGGCDENQSPVDQDSPLWLWDPERSKWAKITEKSDSKEASSTSSKPLARFDHKVFADAAQDIIIVHGGRTAKSGEALKDTWLFDVEDRTWTELPEAPAPATDAAFTEGSLYTITGLSEVSSEMHVLKIGITAEERKASKAEWQTITFPTNPLTPGPRPREGSALLPISTGYGRQYLLYLFGRRQETEGTSDDMSENSPFYSDIWTYQAESKHPMPSSWTDFKPAVIKDAIREKLGYDSGGHSWGEAEVQASEQIGQEGKVHPGPRGFFGADSTEDGKSVVIWGGINPRGEKENDGWIIHLS